MKIEVPELSLVLLIGTSGAGKSTFAKQHFGPYEVVSSDQCRGVVSNDENSMPATKDAFELLNFIIGKRLKNGHLTVVDATNVQAESRKKLVALAREHHVLPVAIVLNMPLAVCEARNEKRADRNFGGHVLRQQSQQLKKSLKGLKREGFRKIHVLNSIEEAASVSEIVREKLYNDKKTIHGPFDIIGDIHGCYDELTLLLEKLGYTINQVPDDGQNYGLAVQHPEGRQVIFLGDLVDRGPASPAVLKLVMSMVRSGTAWCVPGNHDLKLQKKLNGRDVMIKHGLAETLEQLEGETDAFLGEVKEFLYSLVSHYVFDDGKLVVAHAGIKESMQGRGSGAVRSFCLYGETTGEIDEFGLPVRYNWAAEYRGKAKVVYGHTPIPEPEWLNKTLNIDTGCVFGGKLTALRYPEETLVSVPAKTVYSEPARPIGYGISNPLSGQQIYDDLLSIEEVYGKRIIQTGLRNNITIKEENAIAALEVMSRFAINPKWLIYLPPTMSPCGTSEEPGYLEYPQQALNYYKKRGVKQVVCEEKHMGSRAVVVVCKNEKAATEHFGVTGEGLGVCYTRTGRDFFNDDQLSNQFINRVAKALGDAGFWEKHNTDWVCLDTELMPWSAKAQALLKDQYAAVGSAAQNALGEVAHSLQAAIDRGITEAKTVLDKFAYKKEAAEKFVDAYRRYCWPVSRLEDYKLAPFHIMATEGATHVDKPHQWHMEEIAEICKAGPELFLMTDYKIVDVQTQEGMEEAIQWWLSLTAKGGEGMVVKPDEFLVNNSEGLLQPAIKCRGKEYLRIIYGPEYDMPENLKRLRNRGLSHKRSQALREFALGVEALARFVKKEPLRRIHESVFGVLALESEPIDPRL